MKVLILDDEFLILGMLKDYLTELGNEVHTAFNGKMGWETFSQDPYSFDVALVDAKMPIMGGLEFLGKTREQKFDIPVVLMTGYADSNIHEEALKLGAFDVILKPFEFPVMDSLLSKATFFLEIS